MSNTITSLNQFLTKLSESQIRTTNLFEIEIKLPPALNGMPDFDNMFTYNHSQGNILTMFGESFTLPNRTIEFAEAGFKGFNVPVPTVMRMEQDHTMTVRADMQGNNRRAFLAWQAYCINPRIIQSGKNNTDTTGSPEIGLFEGNRRYEQESQIRISLLGSDMRTATETCTLYGVKIQSVGGLTVSNTDASISTFDVGFKSVFWQVEDITKDDFSGKTFNFYENPEITKTPFVNDGLIV